MRKLVLILLCILLTNLSFSQEKRVALVIGNANYLNGAPLANPENDAKDIAEKLKLADFDVTLMVDLDQANMKKVIDEYGEKLENADIGLFFYAGHGVQAKGRNYLIPVDASLKTENDVEYNCVDAGRILGKMEDAETRTNIIILDACRDNPFERSWSRKSTGAGLAFMNAPSGTFIAYSTAPGKTASDGYYRNSPFTAGVLEHINTPNLKIEDLFKLVRAKVRVNSKGAQVPWDASSLEGNFYFNLDPNNISVEISGNEMMASIDDRSKSDDKSDAAQRMSDFETKQKQLAEKIRSIAILPFTNYTGDDNNMYLASGMHDALISELGQLGHVRVTSKTSTLSYADLKKTIKEIASELNVEGIVETSIIGMGDKIRIQLKLYCVYPEEELLWSQVFDSDKSDIFDLFDRVIKNIADEIHLSLSPQQESDLQHSKKVNPKAFEAYATGRHYWYNFTPNDLENAMKYFKLAIEEDENFALAYIGISDTWFGLYQLGVYSSTDPAPLQAIYEALNKALALDSTLAEVHYSLGNLAASVNWDWNACLQEFDIALSINPNYADVYAAYSNMLASLGRVEESIEKINIAVKLDPLNIFTQDLYTMTIFFAGKYDQALANAQNILKMEPNNFLAMQHVPQIYHMMGDYENELKSWKNFFRTHYTNDKLDFDKIFNTNYTEKGYKKTMNLLSDNLMTHIETNYIDIFIIAIFYSCAGNNEKALNILEQCYEVHNPNIPFLLVPTFDNLRSEPRFIELCKKLNLPYN